MLVTGFLTAKPARTTELQLKEAISYFLDEVLPEEIFNCHLFELNPRSVTDSVLASTLRDRTLTEFLIDDQRIDGVPLVREMKRMHSTVRGSDFVVFLRCAHEEKPDLILEEAIQYAIRHGKNFMIYDLHDALSTLEEVRNED